MTGILPVKNLRKTQKPRCFVSEEDYDEKVGEPFRLLIEPKGGSDGPIFYYRKTSDGYEVEGEGYIITKHSQESIAEHRRWVKNHWKNTTLQWIEIDEDGHEIH